MKAVVLAAGKGTRCYPLTLTRPKVLLKVANETILEHNLRQLKGLVEEVIIVIGYKSEMIKEAIGSKFENIKIKYVEQKKQNGTGGALLLCEKFLDGRFIVLNGDDIYSYADIKKCLKNKYCVMAKKVNDPEKWGIFTVKDENVAGIEEKPRTRENKRFSVSQKSLISVKAKSNLANTGLYVFDDEIFNYKLKKSTRREYEVVDYVNYLVGKGERVKCEIASDWIPVGYLWHIIDANEIILSRIKKSRIEGKIEKNVVVKGKLVLGRGSVIKSGTYIEGPVVIGKNCVIGPNCYIRGATSIGNNCKVGNGSEVKNSVIFDNTAIPHLNYVGDSVIGENVNLGAGTRVANLRFDHGEIKMNVNGERVSTGMKKLGAVIGDNVQTGINVSLMPGVRVWPGARVKPGVVVYEDMKTEYKL